MDKAGGIEFADPDIEIVFEWSKHPALPICACPYGVARDDAPVGHIGVMGAIDVASEEAGSTAVRRVGGCSDDASVGHGGAVGSIDSASAVGFRLRHSTGRGWRKLRHRGRHTAGR